MNFFTIAGKNALKGIPVFGDKLGIKNFPLASVSLVEGLFPKVLPSPIDNREYFTLNNTRPDCFIDQGYFYQFKGVDHCGRICKLMPIIIADQPYYSNRSIVMIVLERNETISHERGTDQLWECCLPQEEKKYSYLKLIGIEREGWINIKNTSKTVSFQNLGNKFDVHEY